MEEECKELVAYPCFSEKGEKRRTKSWVAFKVGKAKKKLRREEEVTEPKTEESGCDNKMSLDENNHAKESTDVTAVDWTDMFLDFEAMRGENFIIKPIRIDENSNDSCD